jgi:hypothetical protein
VTSESTTRWPLLNERAPIVHAPERVDRRKLPRSAWLLTGLAFLCGGLVSAAAFSIGWRHQAQRDTAARSALAAATARTHALRASLAAARGEEARQQQAAAAAIASERSLRAAATRVGAQAAASGGAASSVASGADTLTTAAARIASELKTLDTYLTTTPPAELDSGYITTQTVYLSRQLTNLQTAAGTLGASVRSFDAAVRKLTRSAAPLSTH